VVAGFVVFLLVVAGFIGYGWWDSQYGPPHSRAMRVGDTTLNLDLFSRRTKNFVQDLGLSGSVNANSFPSIVSFVLATLEQEILVRERAPADLGLTAAPDEVEAEIARQLNVQTDDAALFETAYEKDLKARDMSDKEYREMVEAGLLTQWAQAGFNRASPTAADQVRIRQILVGAQEDADRAVERLNAGEDFATVAKEMSSDTATKDAGGEKGWVTIEDLEVAALQPAEAGKVFALEAGQRSEPLEGQGGFFIIEVEEKEAGRPLEQAQRDTIGRRYFSLWLDEQRTLIPTVNYVSFDSDKMQWVFDHTT
jgi:parvulin-like peptidyl-prolyl isomerase